MKIFNTFVMTAVFFIVLGFSGCSMKDAIKPNAGLIQKYHDTMPKAKSNETIVYVISAANITPSVEMNGVQSTLQKGEYLKYTLKDDLNTISFVGQHMFKSYAYPFLNEAIDYEKGKTIFYYIDDTSVFSGKYIYRIHNNLGMTLVMQNDYQEKEIEDNGNHAFGKEIFATNPESIMIRKRGKLTQKKDVAQIVFYREIDNIQIQPGIWLRDRYLGSLNEKTHMVVEVKAGQHIFYTNYGSWGVLNAQVEAGKTYYVFVQCNVGLGTLYTSLTPMMPTEKLKYNAKRLKEFGIDKSKIDTKLQTRFDTAFPYIEEVRTAPNTVDIEFVNKMSLEYGD